MAIVDEYYLSDNDKNIVFEFKFEDYRGKETKMCIFAESRHKATEIFRKYEGPKARIIYVKRMTAAEYKEASR